MIAIGFSGMIGSIAMESNPDSHARRTITDEEAVRTSISLIFSGSAYRETSEVLQQLSRYFRVIADGIKGREVRVHAYLLNQFEAVCLLLRDRVRHHPESIQNQIEQILREDKLERTFAILGALSADGLFLIPRPSLLESTALAIKLMGVGVAGRQDNDNALITESTLFQVKIALSRLAQIVQYASTVDTATDEFGFDGLRTHYDPSLLEKPKLLALINLLKMAVAALTDDEIRRTLSTTIDQLEEEIRRPRPRWGRIITGFFVIFGFVADLRSLAPGLYGSIYSYVEMIVKTLHSDGGVEHQRTNPPLLPEFNRVAVLPEPPRLRPHEDDEDGGS